MPPRPRLHPGLSLLPLLAGLLVAATLQAEDFKALSGKTFRQAFVLRLDASTVTIRHAGGVDQLPLRDFSPADQTRLRTLEIERRTTEISQLQRELDQRTAELETLRAIQTQPPATPPPSAPTANPPPTVPAPTPQPTAPSPVATPPTAPLPPPDKNDVVPVRDLIAAYRTNPTAADARFRGRSFRFRGTVAAFHSKSFVRNYSIQFDTGDPQWRLIARCSYRSDWKAVFPTNEGRRLVARIGEQQRPLLQVADDAIFLGTCEGLKDGDVVFSGAIQESPPLPPKATR